jgi:hypothetical protein
MKGSQKLFKDILHVPQTTPTEIAKKGRNTALHVNRNRCIVHRYYFYITFTEKRYATIIQKLEDEFFISQVTIIMLLTQYFGLITEIRKNKLSITDLQKKYPHLVW